MDLKFQNAAVFVKPSSDDVDALERLVALLEKTGTTIWLCERSAALLQERGRDVQGYTRQHLGQHCDLAVVLGGDGTMLGVSRDLADYNLPVIGINAGRLGFITDMVVETMETVLPPMMKGHYQKDTRYLLEGEVLREGEVVYRHVAVNDVGISNGRVGGVVEILTLVDGRPMSCQLADGLICSSTTGSTAYALAAGGPILSPSLDGLCLAPVAAHTLSNRPIVLPGNAVIDMKLMDAREAVAFWDMQEFFDVKPGDVLRIRRSQKAMRLLHPEGWDYFELLRRKLNWNFMPAAQSHGV